MTREQIKEMIINELKKVNSKSNDYICGQAVGMIKMFKATGMLEKSDDMLDEIYDEIL